MFITESESVKKFYTNDSVKKFYTVYKNKLFNILIKNIIHLKKIIIIQMLSLSHYKYLSPNICLF